MLYHHRLDLHGCILLQELVSLNRSSVPGRDEIVKKRSHDAETARVVLIWKDLSLLLKYEVLLEYTRNIARRLDDMDIIHPAQLLHIFSILFSDA